MIKLMKKLPCIALILMAMLMHGVLLGEVNSEKPATEIKVMSFNIWRDGVAGGQPLSQTIRVIRESKADIVGLQEAHQNAEKIAKLLKWHHVQQSGGTAIISRFDIVANSPLRHGVKIKVAPEKVVYMFNVHLMHAPYQPYQLLSIPYHNGRFIKTETDAILEANRARGNQVESLIKDLHAFVPDDASTPVFVTGDFNEPSHLDWTERAVVAGRHPIKVAYPASVSMASA